MIYWGWNIVNTWFMPKDRLYQSPEKVIMHGEPIKKEKKKVKRKPLRHYAMIGKKTLFRPEREEWEPPPPPPPEKPKPSPPPAEPTPPPPPPPLADPILDGVIILSETNRMALMRGSHREERTSTRGNSSRFNQRRHSRTRPTRKSYKVIKDEAKFYHIGDEISEMLIEQILEEKVVLKRKSNGEKVEIPLRSKEKVAQQSAKSVQKKPPTRPTGKRTPPRRSSRFRRRSLRRRTR